MSTIQNVRAVIELNVQLVDGVAPDLAVLNTHSVRYAETMVIQSGCQIAGATLKPRWETPLDNLLEHYETGGIPGGVRDPATVAKHDALIATLGHGKITRETLVQWNYDIELSLAPFSGANP